jgi:Protein of unknown function (DUF1579)
MRTAFAVTLFRVLLLACAVQSAASLFAQGAAKAAADPETDVLKQWVGEWDAVIESTGRDGKPVTSKAKASVKLLGTRWLITDFDGTFLGAPFIGHEVLGYDPIAKKYVLNWIDLQATTFATGEGQYDPQTKTLALNLTGRNDATKTAVNWRQVDIWKDADHHEWTIRVGSPKDGKEQTQITIRYGRRK